MDWSNIFNTGKNPETGGWKTAVQYGNSPFTWNLDGGLAGFSKSFTQPFGRGLQAYGQEPKPQGAFAPPAPPPAPEAMPHVAAPKAVYSALPPRGGFLRAGGGPSWLDRYK